MYYQWPTLQAARLYPAGHFSAQDLCQKLLSRTQAAIKDRQPKAIPHEIEPATRSFLGPTRGNARPPGGLFPYKTAHFDGRVQIMCVAHQGFKTVEIAVSDV